MVAGVDDKHNTIYKKRLSCNKKKRGHARTRFGWDFGCDLEAAVGQLQKNIKSALSGENGGVVEVPYGCVQNAALWQSERGRARVWATITSFLRTIVSPLSGWEPLCAVLDPAAFETISATLEGSGLWVVPVASWPEVGRASTDPLGVAFRLHVFGRWDPPRVLSTRPSLDGLLFAINGSGLYVGGQASVSLSPARTGCAAALGVDISISQVVPSPIIFARERGSKFSVAKFTVRARAATERELAERAPGTASSGVLSTENAYAGDGPWYTLGTLCLLADESGNPFSPHSAAISGAARAPRGLEPAEWSGEMDPGLPALSRRLASGILNAEVADAMMSELSLLEAHALEEIKVFERDGSLRSAEYLRGALLQYESAMAAFLRCGFSSRVDWLLNGSLVYGKLLQIAASAPWRLLPSRRPIGFDPAACFDSKLEYVRENIFRAVRSMSAAGDTYDAPLSEMLGFADGIFARVPETSYTYSSSVKVHASIQDAGYLLNLLSEKVV